MLQEGDNGLICYPDTPDTGGPWVMWQGTPYAHVMVPVPRRVVE